MIKEKLTAKQTIQGDVDLSTFIEGADTFREQFPSSKPIISRETQISSQAGRPADVWGEPRNAVVNVKFTEKEKDLLKEQAGGVPLSSFIRTLLKNYKII